MTHRHTHTHTHTHTYTHQGLQDSRHIWIQFKEQQCNYWRAPTSQISHTHTLMCTGSSRRGVHAAEWNQNATGAAWSVSRPLARDRSAHQRSGLANQTRRLAHARPTETDGGNSHNATVRVKSNMCSHMSVTHRGVNVSLYSWLLLLLRYCNTRQHTPPNPPGHSPRTKPLKQPVTVSTVPLIHCATVPLIHWSTVPLIHSHRHRAVGL